MAASLATQALSELPGGTLQTFLLQNPSRQVFQNSPVESW
jgi:hypothetical protein